VLLALTLPAAVPSPAPTPSAASRSLLEQIAQLQSAQPAAASPLPQLSRFYGRRDFEPAWSNPVAIRQLVSALEHCDEDGLDPADFPLPAIRRLQAQAASGADPERQARLDLLLTESLVRLAAQLAHGKIDPQTLDEDWSLPPRDPGLEQRLPDSRAIESAHIEELLQSLRPHTPRYTRLQQVLLRYRGYRDRGGWMPIADGPTLKPGSSDPRIPALRARLAASGELSTPEQLSTDYDAALANDVRRFQRHHGLTPDGIVGTRTLAALNVPVQVRIDQIRANLERARWATDDLPEDYLLVDIAGFRLQLFHGHVPVWETRAIVGRPRRPSPVLRSTLTWLDINPSWTVPPTVLARDVLPELQKDPAYLQAKDMRVIDYQGKPVDVTGLDWSRVNPHNFPWLIRQAPGPQNALGRIKFMFANGHAVYLHDTPARSLFDHPGRALSSGCIRVEHPLELADLLLRRNAGWNRQRLEAAVASGQTRSVYLAQPIDILLLYRTVEVADDGGVQFNPDIYERDPPLLRQLDAGEPPLGPDSPQPELSAQR
jgi:murein L,D-transpeptidase YcbB/YkuD